MRDPKYKPEQWVIYQKGENRYFGRITGGRVISNAWRYNLRRGENDEHADESQIVAIWSADAWQHQTGPASPDGPNVVEAD